VQRLISGDGMSILGFIGALFGAFFSGGSFVETIVKLLGLIVYNFIYFAFIFGFFVSKVDSDGVGKSRLTALLLSNFIIIPIVLILIFIASLVFIPEYQPSVLDVIVHFITKFNLIDMILPSVVQTVTVIAPSSVATVIVKVALPQPKLEKSHVFTPYDDD
jgi:hypothetical protein